MTAYPIADKLEQNVGNSAHVATVTATACAGNMRPTESLVVTAVAAGHIVADSDCNTCGYAEHTDCNTCGYAEHTDCNTCGYAEHTDCNTCGYAEHTDCNCCGSLLMLMLQVMGIRLTRVNMLAALT
jgi:hypothetical protein